MTVPLPREEQLAIASCPHCGAAVEGAEDRFCCTGCEAASALLHDLELGDWYAQREGPGSRPTVSTHTDWSAVVAEDCDGGKHTTLIVDGLRCASCVWVLERVLERTPGVQSCHVSYASGRATLTWDPRVVTLDRLAHRIEQIGYVPRPVGAPARPDPLFPRLGVALFCTANLMLLTAGLYASWIDGMEPRFQVLFRWLALALASPVAIYSAQPFWQGAMAGLREKRIGMDVPIAISVGVLFLHGIVQTLQGAEGYLDSLGMLVTLLLVGRILESRGRRRTSEAAASIAARLPNRARRRTASGVEDVSTADLGVGDILELGPGVEIAADAKLIEGALEIDAALLTGESAPRVSTPGDILWAGTHVQAGTGAAQVLRTGSTTVASSMAAALREAIDRPRVANPAETLAPAFTLGSLGVALVAGIGWTLASDLGDGIQVAVAVLVVACPCALGLSVPLAISNGLGALARRGVVLRDGDALARLAEVETVAFDKTGTLTVGELTVLNASDEALRIAAGLERASHHPIARALLSEALRRGIPLPKVKDLEEVPGIGVAGILDGAQWSLRRGPNRSVLLNRDGVEVSRLEIGDAVRPDSHATLAALERLGLPVTVLSGDNTQTTKATSEALGALAYAGELLPAQKADWVNRHPHVLFVGDGLNDGPALAEAHVGLAMHSGSGLSLDIADGVICGPDLSPVPVALRGARITEEAVRINLRRSLIYNTLAIGLATAGWVNPLVAAILMPASSAMVWWGARSIERRLEAS